MNDNNHEASGSDDDDAHENSSLVLEHFKSIRAIIHKSDKAKNIIFNYGKTKKLLTKDRTLIVDLFITELHKLTKR